LADSIAAGGSNIGTKAEDSGPSNPVAVEGGCVDKLVALARNMT